MAEVAAAQVPLAEKEELFCSYAAMILKDSDQDVSEEGLDALIKAAGGSVDSFFTSLFAKIVKGKDLDAMLTFGGGGGGGGAAAAGGGAAGGEGAAVQKEEKKEEKARPSASVPGLAGMAPPSAFLAWTALACAGLASLLGYGLRGWLARRGLHRLAQGAAPGSAALPAPLPAPLGYGGDCAPLPMPPSHDFGIFERGDKFVVPKEELLSLPLEGDFAHLAPLMRKLAGGGRGKVVVLGGSETLGQGCGQNATAANGSRVKLKWKDCAWPARFAQWLQASFPRATVDMRNGARGGWGTARFYEILSVVLSKHRDADLFISETAINDMDNRPKRGKNYMSITFERFILDVRKLLPKAGILVVVSPCHGCRVSAGDQVPVARHHRLPLLDMATVFKRHPSFWEAGKGVQDVHPHARTHQVFADLLAAVCARGWLQTCPRLPPGPAEPPALGERTLWPEAAASEACLRPLSVYSARDAGTLRPEVVSGDWGLREDRPGKPGWIAQKPGSRLRFALKLGPEPRFGVSYLRSYQNISDVQVHVKGRMVLLKGRWEPDFKPRISVPDTVWFTSSRPREGSRRLLFQVDPQSALNGVAPGSNATVVAEMVLAALPGQDTQKAKIIHVISC